MKQLLQNLKSGELTVEDVPPPALKDGFVLVRNACSLISPGTEGGTVRLGKASLLGKARSRPEDVRKVLRSIRTEGLWTTYQFVQNTLDLPHVLGYCCAGEVVGVGAGVEDLRVGDRVACGDCSGGGHACHAEVVAVPKNLCVPVPEGMDLRHAAFTTLGSIAMQSLRIGAVRLGENVVVIGLGLVGLLICRLLKAAGCRVFGIDLSPDRVAFALAQGFCDRAQERSSTSLTEHVRGFTSGHGADSVIITAATPDNDPTALAGELARSRAVVVVVGRTVMEAPRETYLFKELELRPSFASGPGTGDPSYEEHGHDYPIGYVRWTERRNMASFVQLAAEGKLGLESLITHEFDVAEAPRAFELITGEDRAKTMAVLLRYPARDGAETTTVELGSAAPATRSRAASAVRVGVIGAGSFATNVLVPTLASLSGVELCGISSAKGVRASSLGKKYGFDYCTSDVRRIIEDPDVDCVFVLTRHDSHAPFATLALEAGKPVFVEKPLAMSDEELDRVLAAREQSDLPLMVGFNRRFSPMSVKMKALFADRTQPLSMTFRANVCYRPPEHWLHDPRQGGGVILGEACHFIDYCHWLAEAELREISVRSIRDPDRSVLSADNVHIQMAFTDGSVATVCYLSNGSPSYGRERVEVLGDNGLAVLDDFRLLEWAMGRGWVKRRRSWLKPDKGYRAQLETFVACVRDQRPLPHQDLYAISSHSTLRAQSALNPGGGLPA